MLLSILYILQVLFRDLDGTLTGLADGGWVTPNSGLHPPDHCTPSVPEFSIGGFNGSMCTSDVYFIRMAWNQATPTVSYYDCLIVEILCCFIKRLCVF